MQTKSGKKITNLKVLGNQYAGIVDGKILTWDENGRRSSKYKSKLDMIIETPKPKPFYVNINEWNGSIHVGQQKFDSMREAVRNKKSGYIKTVKIEL
jgi:hypothetical protein